MEGVIVQGSGFFEFAPLVGFAQAASIRHTHYLSLIMQDSKPQPPSSDEPVASNGSPSASPPPAVADGIEGLDPKMTVMGGGEKEKAADYANCEIT